MTNEQAKQEAIKFLLKLGYELFDKGHYVKGSNSINIEEKAIANEKGEQTFFTSYTELFSILKEHNNGWIRIEPDGSNLPFKGEYKVFDGNNVTTSFMIRGKDYRMTEHWLEFYTHYKPIIPEIKPIY